MERPRGVHRLRFRDIDGDAPFAPGDLQQRQLCHGAEHLNGSLLLGAARTDQADRSSRLCLPRQADAPPDGNTAEAARFLRRDPRSGQRLESGADLEGQPVRLRERDAAAISSISA